MHRPRSGSSGTLRLLSLRGRCAVPAGSGLQLGTPGRPTVTADGVVYLK